MRTAVVIFVLSLPIIVFAQQQSGTASLDDLDKQLIQKKQAKKSADDANAAKAARAAQQARIDAIKAAAQHLTGRWVGNITLTNEPIYWCKVETTHTFTMDLGSLDPATSKMDGYMTHATHFTSSYYGKTYEGRSASTNKRIDSCRSDYNGNRVDKTTVYLRFAAGAQSHRIDYIEESCTGAGCPQQLGRGSFQMATLDNGQAELTVNEGTVRMAHN
jgi:hypothetical protein